MFSLDDIWFFLVKMHTILGLLGKKYTQPGAYKSRANLCSITRVQVLALLGLYN